VTTYAVYKDPTIADFLVVCHNLCPDEIEQYEAFAGAPYDAGRVAALFSLHEGPRWVLVADGQPIVIGGFDEIRPGVWQDWLFSTPDAWSEAHWRKTTRGCKRMMDVMLRTVAHRLQCVSLASRTRAHEWYGVLGLELEGPRRQYGAGRQDALEFSRVRSL
jgi:hypothetical protein